MSLSRTMVAAALTAATLVATAGTAAADDTGTIADTYRSVYPKISATAAETAATQADARRKLYSKLSGEHAATFGGAWFDPPSGVVHVAATTQETAGIAAAAGRSLGLRVQTHLVEHSHADLERKAAVLRDGGGELGRAARGQVGIDVENNRVVAAVPAHRRTGLLENARTAGVSVVADPEQRPVDDACTSRTNCDDSLRAGSVLWRRSGASNINWCSAGFTARDPWDNRYIFTAGHCTTGAGVTWGTGSQSIGPMWAAIDSGSMDVALIQVTSSTFTNDLGGELYHEDFGDRSADVDGFARTLSYIVQGETVCLSANYVVVNGRNRCGVIDRTSDWWNQNKVRVDGVDACGGDSGGGWYWLANGRREAYGIHSESDEGCNGGQGGDHSWFTPMPTALALLPVLTVETR